MDHEPQRHPAFSAVVLAGGTAARMDGVDKAGLEVAGRTLLALAVDALLDADEVVVVGAAVPTERPVTFTREDPPSGGPAAGLLTGRDALLHPPEWLGVLAVDMPRVTTYTFRRLRDAAIGYDAAFLVDESGRRQLAGVVQTVRLDAVRPDHEGQHGMPLHRLLGDLTVAEVPAEGAEARDVDTWADLRDLRG
ncbi:NTP transferase domain-containing protein [Nocardioides sp. InS609-2]|uniref:molybdenum cofactor guanylyltransferase n=1 Tax=Nocardioides sp. InS609-2 TaxID=2760705 RepID=UPI0020C003FF|nr:NTP transferase domain-containing protein [Nocardioides sp. InS609-2]